VLFVDYQQEVENIDGCKMAEAVIIFGGGKHAKYDAATELAST
jgi:hypothetical protein